ncbi:hypothetical protein GCM10009727_54790 [Actinomadura napierensis]|uniref:Uncharacterized protein n=1 Tax=Actinomadura napierensis TaxID=267854 RepID=A0ABP5LMZ7_9ACTN
MSGIPTVPLIAPRNPRCDGGPPHGLPGTTERSPRLAGAARDHRSVPRPARDERTGTVPPAERRWQPARHSDPAPTRHHGPLAIAEPVHPAAAAARSAASDLPVAK